MQDLAGLVGQPILFHTYPVLELLDRLQQAVGPGLDRHLGCLLQLLRPEVLLVDLQQLHLVAELRVHRGQHNRADVHQVVLMEIPLELSVGHDAVVVRILLQLGPRFHQFQLERKEQVVGGLGELSNLGKQLDGLPDGVLYEGVLCVGDLERSGDEYYELLKIVDEYAELFGFALLEALDDPAPVESVDMQKIELMVENKDRRITRLDLLLQSGLLLEYLLKLRVILLNVPD